jgi:hypothetical protein
VHAHGLGHLVSPLVFTVLCNESHRGRVVNSPYGS